MATIHRLTLKFGTVRVIGHQFHEIRTENIMFCLLISANSSHIL
jgi:hypothetical protein